MAEIVAKIYLKSKNNNNNKSLWINKEFLILKMLARITKWNDNILPWRHYMIVLYLFVWFNFLWVLELSSLYHQPQRAEQSNRDSEQWSEQWKR